MMNERMKDFVVVSLFDGISIAMSSLIRLGIYPAKYYASEIDPYAISISKYNFPDIIRLGDVTRVTGDEIKEPVDLLIGGSPCTDFSFAGNMLQFEGEKGKLFFEYERLLKILKPKYFLLENVKMPKQSSEVISDMLEVDYVEINSKILSAQNRRRLYWSNLKITQPKPQGLLLKDIIQDGEVGHNYTNEPNFMERYNDVKAGFSFKQQKLMNVNPSGRGLNGWVYSTNGTSSTVTTNKGEGSKIYVGNEYVVAGQPQAVDPNYKSKGKKREERIEWRTDGKSNTLLPNPKKNLLKNTTHKVDDKYWLKGKTGIRRVTPVEAERLQTLPDDYTASGIDKNGNQVKISDSRRYFVLGNGFTADVISWILSPLLKDNPEMNNKHSRQLELF